MLSHINVGTGEDLSIHDLAALVAGIIGYTGRIEYDSQYPDGAPRKLLDVSLLSRLGWRAHIRLRDGIRATYDAYRSDSSSMAQGDVQLRPGASTS
jgi:GDP-L-fucose synthase